MLQLQRKMRFVARVIGSEVTADNSQAQQTECVVVPVIGSDWLVMHVECSLAQFDVYAMVAIHKSGGYCTRVQ